MWAYWTRFSGVGVGVGADVEQDQGPGLGDHLDGQRRPIDARRAAQPQHRGGHPGARVAGRDHRVGAAALHEVAGHEDGGVLLLAERLRRMLVHLDDLGGRLDRDVGGQPGAGDGRDPLRDPHQDHLVAGVVGRVEERTRDDLGRGMVAAHRVDGEANLAATLEAPDGREVHRLRVLAARGRAAVRRPPRRPSS